MSLNSATGRSAPRVLLWPFKWPKQWTGTDQEEKVSQVSTPFLVVSKGLSKGVVWPGSELL